MSRTASCGSLLCNALQHGPHKRSVQSYCMMRALGTIPHYTEMQACRAVRRYLHVPLSSRAHLRGTARKGTRSSRQHATRGTYRSRSRRLRKQKQYAAGTSRRQHAQASVRVTLTNPLPQVLGGGLTPPLMPQHLPRHAARPLHQGRATRVAPVANSASATTARGRSHTSREAKPRGETRRLSFTGP